MWNVFYQIFNKKHPVFTAKCKARKSEWTTEWTTEMEMFAHAWGVFREVVLRNVTLIPLVWDVGQLTAAGPLTLTDLLYWNTHCMLRKSQEIWEKHWGKTDLNTSRISRQGRTDARHAGRKTQTQTEWVTGRRSRNIDLKHKQGFPNWGWWAHD